MVKLVPEEVTSILIWGKSELGGIGSIPRSILFYGALLGVCRPQGSLFEPNFPSQGSIFG